MEKQAKPIANADTEEKIFVLHVDDDPFILKVSKQILELDGKFQVEVASSVDEAFQKLGSQEFEAVISDYEMPGKNGLEFLEELRRQKNEIAFVVFTGRGREEIAVKALNLGADRYINKNGDPETVYCELSYAVNNIVERKRARRALVEDARKINALNEKLRVVGSLTRHDVRNKLSNVNAHAYLLKRKLKENTSQENPEAINHILEIEQASKQIVELLEFARIYEKLGAEELKAVDVEKCVDEAKSLIDLKEIKLTNQCQGLTVTADSLLRQLFYNLIDNTIKHGEESTKICVRFESGDSATKLIYEDNGEGIPETAKKNLFVEKTSTGVGHGLFIVRRICEAYDWTISETGKNGHGAQFTINIPKLSPKKTVATQAGMP